MNDNNQNKEGRDSLRPSEEISPLNIVEPELKAFDASEIFEVKEPAQTKRSLFGKRSQKGARLRVRQDVFAPEEEKTEPEQPEKEEQAVFSEHPDIAPAVTELKQADPEDLPAYEPEPEADDEDEYLEVTDNDEVEEESDDYEEDEYYQDDELELYEDKKRFLLSQYPMVEDYLAEQSQDGYHYVRHVGKKYYFTKGDPGNFYYSICFFREEPSAADWKKWEADGWQLVSRSPGKKRHEAGWFTFRHPVQEGEYKKAIDNDAEKYRFFRKYANSCRSTMFLVFICMACCLVTAFLQYQFQGYLWTIIVCLVLFLIALIVFLQYDRMLRYAKKRARMLQSKLRIQEAQKKRIRDEEYNTSETEADLENDWETLG